MQTKRGIFNQQNKKINFTLYSAHNISCCGRGNLVLRHSVHHFPRNSGDIACGVELDATLCASTPERTNENINVNKYFISIGDRTH